MKKLVLFSFFLMFTLSAYAQKCPRDGMSMYFTGRTQIEWGKLLKVYRCPSGHEYLLNSEQSSSSLGNSSQGSSTYGNSLGSSSTQSRCPICNSSVYFTGETDISSGRLLKIYKCPVGHRSIGP